MTSVFSDYSAEGFAFLLLLYLRIFQNLPLSVGAYDN